MANSGDATREVNPRADSSQFKLGKLEAFPEQAGMGRGHASNDGTRPPNRGGVGGLDLPEAESSGYQWLMQHSPRPNANRTQFLHIHWRRDPWACDFLPTPEAGSDHFPFGFKVERPRSSTHKSRTGRPNNGAGQEGCSKKYRQRPGRPIACWRSLLFTAASLVRGPPASRRACAGCLGFAGIMASRCI